MSQETLAHTVQRTTTSNNESISNDKQQQSSTSTSKKDQKKEVTILPSNTKGLHTVFIHKLYNMLEDEELKHLIWWSKQNDSFFIAPGEEFSKALPQYFKHTNVASFVRQLNMYGFHKVSDNNGSQASNYNNSHDLTTWEFRHSSGHFKKGDIDGLKSIKRRSSKHGSSTNNNNSGPTRNNSSSHLDLGSMSDSDFGSERSNSLTDLTDMSNFSHLQQTPNNQVSAGNNGNSVDPLLNIRLAELGHNLAALRHENARLQLKYDIALEDIRKTNIDMVHLLELFQKIMQSDKGDCEKLVKEVESDIANFKNIIVQRAGMNGSSSGKEFDEPGFSFAPSYQSNGQIPRSNPSKSTKQQEQHYQAPQSPNDPSTPVPYPYPYPYSSYQQPQHQPQSQPTEVGHHSSSQHPTPNPQQPTQQPHQTPFHQLMHDPFQTSRKSSASSSSRARNMSVYDPLQPGHSGNGSPSTFNIARNSLSGPTSNPDTNAVSPMVSNSGYSSDYNNPTYSHHHQNPQFQDKSRDQRPGSFPGLIASVQNSLHGDSLSGPGGKKRHSSNDTIDYNKLNIPVNLQPPHHYPQSQPHRQQQQHLPHQQHPHQQKQHHQPHQHHQPMLQHTLSANHPRPVPNETAQYPVGAPGQAYHPSAQKPQSTDNLNPYQIGESVNRFQSGSSTGEKGQKRESVYSLLNPEKTGSRNPVVKKSRVQ